MQAVLLPASPSSSDDEVAEGDEHDIHNVREELAIAGQTFQSGCQEVKRLKECLVVAETALVPRMGRWLTLGLQIW
jgi:hypothetical protein